VCLFCYLAALNKRSLLVNSKKESNHPFGSSTTQAPVVINDIPSAFRIRSAIQSQQETLPKHSTSREDVDEVLQDDDDSIITFPNDSTTKAPKTYRYVPVHGR